MTEDEPTPEPQPLTALQAERARLVDELARVENAIVGRLDTNLPQGSDPSGMQQATTALLDYLTGLRVQVGYPSVRTIAEGCGSVSHATVGNLFSGYGVPGWKHLWAIGGYLDADETHLKELWNQYKIAEQRRKYL